MVVAVVMSIWLSGLCDFFLYTGLLTVQNTRKSKLLRPEIGKKTHCS